MRRCRSSLPSLVAVLPLVLRVLLAVATSARLQVWASSFRHKSGWRFKKCWPRGENKSIVCNCHIHYLLYHLILNNSLSMIRREVLVRFLVCWPDHVVIVNFQATLHSRVTCFRDGLPKPTETAFLEIAKIRVNTTKQHSKILCQQMFVYIYIWNVWTLDIRFIPKNNNQGLVGWFGWWKCFYPTSFTKYEKDREVGKFAGKAQT